MSRKIEQTRDKLEELILNTPLKGFLEGPYRDGFEQVQGHPLVTWDSEDSFPAKLANNIVSSNRTSTIGPRSHSKSTIFGSYALWRMARAKHYLRILWIHYKQDRAGQLIKTKVREIAEESAFIKRIFEDLSPRSKYKYEVRNMFGAKCVLEPIGLYSAPRSIHADIVIADDVLKAKETSTGESRATPREVAQATQQFFTSITSIPEKRTGELHYVGTAMAKDDLGHQLMKRPGYVPLKMPAVFEPEFNEKQTKITSYEGLAWPEFYDLELLNDCLSDAGTIQAFKKEYLCEPASEVDAFLDLEKLNRLFGYEKNDKPAIRKFVGGHDIGKASNPGHAYIFGVDDKGHMWEEESHWFPVGTEYATQLNWWRSKFAEYNDNGKPIALAYYDNTRAEFEAMAEQGQTPKKFKPHNLARERWKLATELQRRVQHLSIHFKPHTHDIDQQQLGMMDTNLKAPEQHGQPHADNFWSGAFSAYAAAKVAGGIGLDIRPDLTNEKLSKQSRWNQISGGHPRGTSRWKLR